MLRVPHFVIYQRQIAVLWVNYAVVPVLVRVVAAGVVREAGALGVAGYEWYHLEECSLIALFLCAASCHLW